MTFNEAVAHFKTQAEIARRLGITTASVNEWRLKGIPLGRQYQIQVLTDGVLKAAPIGEEAQEGI